jgi:hypothetical protein
MTTASTAASSPSVLQFIVSFWWLAFIIIPVIGSLFEGIRDFFLETYREIVEIHHAAKPAEITSKPTPADYLAPGPCQHLHVTPVVDELDDKVVAWLCKNEECSRQLPASWAVRKKDLA